MPADYKPTQEEILEKDLASRHPIVFEDDKEQVGDSEDSIAWAEQNLGEKLVLPKKEAMPAEMVRVDQRFSSNQEWIDDQDWNDDEDIKTTLKSAH